MAQAIARHTPLRYVTDYARQSEPDEETIDIPEDLSVLSDAELEALTDQALTAFDALDDGEATEESIEQMSALADGIDALRAEKTSRDEAASERSERAAEIAARVRPVEDSEEAEEVDEDSSDEADDDAESEDDSETVVAEVDAETGEVTDVEDEQPQAVAASAGAKRRTRINLSGIRHRQGSTPRPSARPTGVRDVIMAAPDVPGFANGQGMDFLDMGRAVDSRLTTFNQSSYENAANRGRHLRQQYGVAVIRKPYADGLRIENNDPGHVDEVFNHAADETRLDGGSLVASGGWCAPSETLYDLFGELEGRDGLFSLPEVNVTRGGIRWTMGPDFATLFSEITGFHYTEAQDEAGQYGVDATGEGNDSAGSKPCYHIGCPDFTEQRLELDGLCITAGLLQQKGYPEVIARTIRGALVAHDHRLAARRLASIIADSDAVALPAGQAGAAAPILTAIELQVEHYKQIHRMSRAQSLEGIFPFWVRGAIRADLSRRLGVDLFDVPDTRINAWFTNRGINPQFVYNFDDLTGAAADAVAYPTEVKFLLYAAGTWVGGGSDVITVDTLYDSTLLGENDYTALFTEEGWLVAKRGHDSRVVTVPICPDGATSAGVAIECNGAEAAAAPAA